MVLWLLRHVWPLFQQVERHTSGDSRVYLTFRIAMASVTAFMLALLFGPLAIRWLKKHFRERVASASTMLDTLHAGKTTPRQWEACSFWRPWCFRRSSGAT